MLHNIAMNLHVSLEAINPDSLEKIPHKEGFRLSYGGYWLDVFVEENKVCLECALGPVLEQSTQSALKLSEILQYNLKCVQALKDVLFWEEKERRLFLRRKLPLEVIQSQKLKENIDDFLLGLEVLEERFFEKR